MPIYQKPNTDEQRLELLHTTVEQHKRDQEQGHPYLVQRTVTQATHIVQQFEAVVQANLAAERERRQAMHAADSARNKLQVEVNSLWASVRWRVRRQEASPALYTYYQLDQSGRPAHPGDSRQGWVTIAARLLQGDTEALAAGYPGVTNRTQLEQNHQQAQHTLTQLQSAESKLHAARIERTKLRLNVDQLCRSIISELRHALHQQPAALRRQVMRSYGARFTASVGEVEGIKGEAGVDSSVAHL